MALGKMGWGVPQGSVLGPLLFCVAVADIGEGVTGASITQFADDVSLVVGGKTGEEAIQKMNRALQQFEEYTAGNWMAAEPTKTQIMYCTGTKRRVAMDEEGCEMGGHKIRAKKMIEVLGFKLEEEVSGEAQCAEAAARGRRAMWKVQRATKYLGREDRAMLMEMMVHPHLEYGQNALKEVTRAAEGQVRRAYNLTARVTAQTGRTKPALKALGWAGWRKRRAAVRKKWQCACGRRGGQRH